MQHAPICDTCGQEPAPYVLASDLSDDNCEQCAQVRGNEANGRAVAAFETLGFAVGLARSASVSEEQIREAFEAILTAPHSTGLYPVGGDHVLGGDSASDRPWRRIYETVA